MKKRGTLNFGVFSGSFVYYFEAYSVTLIWELIFFVSLLPLGIETSGEEVQVP